MIGTSFGPYEIIELLGAGGMGEVYRARDTRLGREVAVKVLPAEFADDPERLARFEQEARAAAALNHANIAVVFDIGAEGDTRYFVQEYLHGEDLRQRLERGAPALDRTLRLATGIARGLSAAHRAEVVHRDLKPENIFITEEGEPKVLDFGLAKMTEGAVAEAAGDAESPTQLQTAAGTIMGTPGYMAPEQIMGGPVDARTDLFAFGCLLYELVSGTRAFSGDSDVQTMNRIVHEPARPLQEIVATPPELQRIVGKCLAKEPRRRYQTAADLVIDLEVLAVKIESGEARAPEATATEPEALGSSRGPSVVLAGGLVALAALGGLAIGWWAGGDRSPAAGATHVTLVERIVPRNDPGVAISPDGRTVVFLGADAEGNEGLFLRSLDEPDSRAIPGTTQAHSPTFSPDGRWVAYYDDEDRSLRKVNVATGDIRVLSTETGGHLGATWTDDGAVVFASFEGGLGRVPADGGEPELLVAPESTDERYRFPRFLPGGGDVLMTIEAPASQPGTERTAIGIVDAADGTVRVLLEAASDPRYLDPGRLLFRRQDALQVVQFDPARRALIGEPTVLRRGIASTADGPFVYDVSRSGTLVLLRAQEYPVRDERTVVVVDRSGRETPLVTERQAYSSLRVAPDGRRLAVQIGAPNATTAAVWLHDLQAGTRAPLVATAVGPVWTRDGEWVAVSFQPSPTEWRLVMQRSDLSGEQRQIDIAPGLVAPQPLDFGVDDRTLLVQDLGRRDATLVVPVQGDALPESVAEGRTLLGPALSPDGRWLAFTSIEEGRPKIYVQEISTGRRWPVSSSGGGAVRWRGDGRELFYWRNEGLYAAAVRADASGWASDPGELLFEGRYEFEDDGWTAYDVAPDGQRFFLIRDDGPAGWQPTRLELILNARSLVESALAEGR